MLERLEERVEALELAQRESGAQITAITSVLMAVAPYLCAPGAELRTVLNAAYDTTSKLMDEAGHDAEYQQLVLAKIRKLSERLAGGYTTHPHQKSPESDAPPRS
jgi:hypothetical protein